MRDGVLVVNKPQGLTSHDVVALVRRKLGVQRVGHAGTLDPMAEGVLVVLIGRATKAQQTLQTHSKVYEATIRLGTQTDTGDAWGNAVRTMDVPPIDEASARTALAEHVGPLTQTPPAYSAVKVRGRPLYWWARRGTPMEAKPRTIEVFSAELLGVEPGALRCRVACSSGTYVRNLAESIATRLGTVGHVSRLVRQSSGAWDLSRAVDTAWIESADPEAVWDACAGP